VKIILKIKKILVLKRDEKDGLIDCL
jgi:hypothetical protein